jgi:hypothetical protein
MNFSYTGGGTVYFCGCFRYRKFENIKHKYSVGDILFYLPKAQKGKLEKIVIKKVQMVRSQGTFGKPKFLYIDTYNSIYNERDLVWEGEALVTARNYYEIQAAWAKIAINPCREW